MCQNSNHDFDRDGSLVVEGVRADGSRFRPSDWIERLSTHCARFGSDQRLRWSPELQPAIVSGRRCLLVDPALRRRDPDCFDFVLRFVNENDLRIRPAA